jgi:dipeptidyl aminopeptidase/acylaminoacyl peptidase
VEEMARILLIVLVVLGILLAIGLVLLAKVNRVINEYLFWRPSKDSDTDIPFGIPYEKVEFRSSDGIELVGWFIPAQANGLGTVIVASGFEYNRNTVIENSLFLYNAGYNLFVFDPRGQGESKGIYALGSKEPEDIEGAIKWLREKKEIEKVALLGYSCGATASLIAAYRHQDEVFAVIADSPFANLNFWGPKITQNVLGSKIFLPIYNLIASIRLGYDLFRATNALKIVNKVSNVFFIHGMNDKTVSYKSSMRLFKKAKEPKKVWLTNVGHVESFAAYPKEYATNVLDFLEKSRTSRASL